MRNLKRVLLVFAAFGSMTLFTACGNSATNANPSQTCPAGQSWSTVYNSCVSSNLVNQQGIGNCPVGQAWSATYNACLQQITSCSGNSGILNGSCVPLGGTNAATGNHSPYQGQCSYGYVQTTYGCLQQGVCSAGYGFGYWAGQPYCFQTNATY